MIARAFWLLIAVTLAFLLAHEPSAFWDFLPVAAVMTLVQMSFVLVLDALDTLEARREAGPPAGRRPVQPGAKV